MKALLLAVPLGLAGCDRVCGPDCHDMDASDATLADASDATRSDAQEADGLAASTDASSDAPPRDDVSDAMPSDAMEDAGGGECPTRFVVLGPPADLSEAGFAASSVVLAYGWNGAWWFAAHGQEGRGFGYLAADSSAVVFVSPPCSACEPAAVARGPDASMWFTLDGWDGGMMVAPLAHTNAADASLVLQSIAQNLPRAGLGFDPRGRFWWISANIEMDWADADGGPTAPVRRTGLALTALAIDDAGQPWFTGSTPGPSPVFGFATPDALMSFPVPLPDGAAASAAPGGIAAGADGAIWFLVSAPLAQGGGWIVRATGSNANTFPFQPEAGAPYGIAALPTQCGVLVTHDPPGGLTLVAPDGSMRDLQNIDGAILPPATAIAVGDSTNVAVVIQNPPHILLLQLQ